MLDTKTRFKAWESGAPLKVHPLEQLPTQLRELPIMEAEYDPVLEVCTHVLVNGFGAFTCVLPRSVLNMSGSSFEYLPPVTGHENKSKGGCASCGELPKEGQTFARCSGCSILKYCTVECQRNHWAEHKAVCKLIQQKKTRSC